MGVLARTIAMIDDDDRVLESFQNLLASCGYKAETYSSAELFLSSVRSLAPVALSQMSRCDG
jgi:FixJ family two-component response regulator